MLAGVASREEATSGEGFAEEDCNGIFKFGKSHLKMTK